MPMQRREVNYKFIPAGAIWIRIRSDPFRRQAWHILYSMRGCSHDSVYACRAIMSSVLGVSSIRQLWHYLLPKQDS